MSSRQQVQNKGFASTVYDGWLLFAELAGRLNSKIIVGIIYFLLVSVVWFFSRVFMKDRPLLDREFRRADSSVWIKKDSETAISIETMRHQF